jgi:glycosyltransferase involved in cell wall biosynthesis
MKRVLIVQNHCVGFGGDDVVVANESALLASKGHEVSLWTLRNDELKAPAQIIETAWHVAYNRAARDELACHVARFGPDVMHCHNLFPRITASAYDAAARYGVPVVQTLHDFRSVCCANAFLYRDGKGCDRCVTGSTYWAGWFGCYRGSRLASLWVARALDVHRRSGTLQRAVQRFIALSQASRRKFIEAGLPADRVVAKPNFTPDPGTPQAARGGALYVGRLSVEKGIATLARAWQGIDYPLDVLGTGPSAAPLQRVASGPITLLGHGDSAAVALAMQRARFLVMPSLALEGFPMVVAEAFANGLPIIASRIGTLAEVIDDGLTGLHFHPGDAVDLARKVQWAIAHPERMAEMGRAARRAYETRYSAELNYRQMMRIYEQAATCLHEAAADA